VFALELDFHDGISPPETILVRRVNAVVGSSDLAHVVIEGATSSLCELRLVRGLGREFGCYPVKRRGQDFSPPSFVEGAHQDSTNIQLGDVSVQVTALDGDLAVVPDEYFDSAAIRIFRRALTTSSPVFPAVAVLGAKPVFVSFHESSPLLVGRSRNCGLRLDASDVSSEHARIGLDDDSIWVEDLGSTNGTFVGGEAVSGRRYIQSGERITLGSEFSLVPVVNSDEVSSLTSEAVVTTDPTVVKSFPCIVTSSKAVRPSRFPLREGARVRVGRDPANDIWVSAAHVSRSHVEICWNGGETFEIMDSSSNGTFVAETRLVHGERKEFSNSFTEIDLCSDVILAVCFDEIEEGRFFSEEVDNIDAPPKADPLDETRRTYLEPDEGKEQQRALERAVGLGSEYTSEDDTNSEAGVFEKMAQIQANRAQTPELDASEYFDVDTSLDAAEVAAVSAGPLESVLGARELAVGQTEFERYQQEQEFRTEELLEVESDYSLISAADEEDDFLEGSLASGVTRPILAFGIFALVVFVVFLCVVIFSNNPLFY